MVLFGNIKSNKMSVEEILDFLREKPGYSREGKRRLTEVLTRKGYNVKEENCATALRLFNRSEEEMNITEVDVIHGVPEGFRIKSMWQQGDKMLYSYERTDTDEDISDILQESINELAEYNNKRPYFPILKKGSGVVLHTIADLHIGAFVEGLINTPDYSIEVVVDKLQEVANEINSQNNKENHIAILGDLIESFTGLNHINSWKSMQQGAYGGKVLILAYEIILDFLSRIENLSGVYIVAGNHDRVTSNNKEDTEGDVAKIISYFLTERLSCPVEYDNNVISLELDGVNYILHHGHKGFSRGDLADIVLAYGKGNMFKVVLSGHLHTRMKKDRNTYINEDTRKYRAYTCPSIFTGNSYSEDGNWTTVSGFYSLINKKGIPQVIDTPIQ